MDPLVARDDEGPDLQIRAQHLRHVWGGGICFSRSALSMCLFPRCAVKCIARVQRDERAEVSISSDRVRDVQYSLYGVVGRETRNPNCLSLREPVVAM